MSVSTNSLSLVRLLPGLVQLLRLRRPSLQQPHRQHDIEQELEILALPVLRHIDGEVGGRQIATEGDLVEAVGELLVVELVPACEGLPHQRQQEQQSEDEAEGVLLQEPAHVTTSLVPHGEDQCAEEADRDDGEIGDVHGAHAQLRAGGSRRASARAACNRRPAPASRPRNG